MSEESWGMGGSETGESDRGQQGVGGSLARLRKERRM